MTIQMPHGSSRPLPSRTVRSMLFSHVIGASSRRSSASPFARPAHQQHRAERDDERHDAQAGDEHAVHQAARGARGDRAGGRDQRPRSAAKQLRGRRRC